MSSLGAFGCKKRRFSLEKVDVGSITTQNLAKLRFKKAIMDRKKEREKRRSTLRGMKTFAPVTPNRKPQLRLDRKNYGAWYLDPEDWEKRFHRKTKKTALEHCIHTRESRYPEQTLDHKAKDLKPAERTKTVEKDTQLQEDRNVSSRETLPLVETPEIDDEEISQVRDQWKFVTFPLMILLYLKLITVKKVVDKSNLI